MEIGYIKTKTAIILWDVRRLAHDIRMNYHKYEVRMIPVVNIYDQSLPIYPEDEDCDITVFPIVLSLGKDKFRVVTGASQINKARALGFKHLECFYVNQRQHKKYIIDYDKETYERAVKEYWSYDENGHCLKGFHM